MLKVKRIYGGGMVEKFTIGEVAEKTGVSVRTLRYYDEIGLLKPTKDESSGHRMYTEKDLLTLHKILSLKFLGFRLDQIRDILSNQTYDLSLKGTLVAEKQMLEQKKKELEERIQTIGRVMELLEEVGEIDSNVLMSLLRSMQTKEKQKEWMAKIFDEETAETIFAMDDEKLTKRTDKLFVDFSKKVMELYPKPIHTPEVQDMIGDYLKEMFTFFEPEMIQNLFSPDQLNALQTSDIAELDNLSPSPFPKEIQDWLNKASDYFMEHSYDKIAQLLNQGKDV